MRRVFETSITGFQHAPHRVALGLLSGGPILWSLFFVTGPLAVLGAALVVDARFAPFAVGFPLLLALTFWWSGYRYASPRVTVDPARQTIRVEHESTPAWTRDWTVDATDLEGASVVPLGTLVLVRLDYATPNVVRPWDFVIDRSDTSAAVAALRSCGVAVREPADSEAAAWPRLEVAVRLVVTPVVLLGVPLAALAAFGTRALDGNVVFVAGLVVAWTMQAQARRAAGISPDSFALRIALDAVGTLVVLLAVAWLVAVLAP